MTTQHPNLEMTPGQARIVLKNWKRVMKEVFKKEEENGIAD